MDAVLGKIRKPIYFITIGLATILIACIIEYEIIIKSIFGNSYDYSRYYSFVFMLVLPSIIVFVISGLYVVLGQKQRKRKISEIILITAFFMFVVCNFIGLVMSVIASGG